MKPEFEKEFPAEINTLIRPFTDVPQKKSDSGNGYYIVSDVWGTCFHRIATKKERFEVQYINNRSYTKIPSKCLRNTYHCVVNFEAGTAFEIQGDDFVVVGVHEPCKHVAKEYYTQSFIVHAITPPTVKEVEALIGLQGLWVDTGGKNYMRPEALLSKYPMHYITPYKD